MRFLYTALILLVSQAVVAQNAFTKEDFSRIDWLEGAWKGTTPQGPFYEAWRKLDDSTLVNFSIEIAGSDTIIKEATALRLRAGQLLLGDVRTVWTGSRLVTGELVLRNDTMRFSRTIIWLHTAEDHWFTVLEHPRTTAIYDMTRDPALAAKVAAWLRNRKGVK